MLANTNADYVLPRWSLVSLPTLSWERVESGHKSRHIISERNDCTLLCSQLMCRYKILALFPDLFHDSILCKFRTASDERAWPGNEAYKIPLYTQVYYCPSRGSWLKAWKRNSRICIPPHLSGRWEHLHLLTGTSRVDPLPLQWRRYRKERNSIHCLSYWKSSGQSFTS